MTRLSDFLRWYIRSSLGIAVLLASIAAGTAAVFAGAGLIVAMAVGAAFFTASTTAALFSGAGARAAVRERDRGAESSLAAYLAEADRKCGRIAALRIPDTEVDAGAEGFAVTFREYLDVCMRLKTRDPQADEAADDVLSALTGFLRELDGSALEKRFNLPDADPFSDAKERTLAYLQERTAFVRARRISVEGGLGGRDRLSIQEELR